MRRAAPLAALAAVFWQLMAPPVPGIADNGDFAKMLGRYRLSSGVAFEYANTKLHFAGKYLYHSGYESSEVLLIAPAVAIGKAISRDGSFDLRAMGAVHAALFLLAVFLVVPLLDRAWLGVVLVVVFCDFMYAGFLNSFYMDVAALLFTFLAAAFYLRAMRWGRARDSAALGICMLLAVLAGPHYSVMAPWFAIVPWAERGVLCGGRKTVAAVATVALLGAAWIPYRYLVAADYAGRNPFNAIFSQILPISANPDRTLAELGLDGSYRRFKGMTSDWHEVGWSDAEFRREFTRKTGYPTILRIYLRHPAGAWNALRSSLDVSGSFQSPLGNFDSGSGRPPAAHYERFRLVSRVKQRLFFQHGARLFRVDTGLALLVPALLLWKRRELPRGAVTGGIVLAGMAESMLVASALADVFDQFRHQLVSFALFDMLLLCLLWLAARIVGQAGSLRRDGIPRGRPCAEAAQTDCATIETSKPQTGRTIFASRWSPRATP